jgi:two-component system nitrate/nitrite response regulator NarL
MMDARNAPIRITIADDHPVYREGVARLIRQRRDLQLTAECANGEEALAAIKTTRPDVALLDVRLPGHSGIDVLKQVRANGKLDTHVVMLSAFDDPETVYEAIAAGAEGYLVKDATRDEICDALVAVAHGQTVLPPAIQAGLVGEIRHQAQAPQTLLTSREHEVLKSAAGGHQTRAIARELFISEATVKTHLNHIYEKLGVSDRVSAVAEAMRRGLLD